MHIRQVRQGNQLDIPGKLPTVLVVRGESYITTTVFVKYSYSEAGGHNLLQAITIAAIPNGMLQNRYNPTFDDTIWVAGPDAPSRGEEFRTRLSFHRLKGKANWRVQKIHLDSDKFHWDE
jgi:hypothetical protein